MDALTLEAVSKMSLNEPPAPPPRSTLLGIPVEIRLRILRILLVSSRRVICPLSTPFNPITLSRSAQILRVNRQLYSEGSEGINILWEENTFWYIRTAGDLGMSSSFVDQPTVFGGMTRLIKTLETSLPLGPDMLNILKAHTGLEQLTLFFDAAKTMSLVKLWDEAEFDEKLTLLLQHLEHPDVDTRPTYSELLELSESFNKTEILLTAPGPAREGKQIVRWVSYDPT